MITITRVSHRCQGHSIEAIVDDTGRYWWGLIDGVTLKFSIPLCPQCGVRLPLDEPSEKPPAPAP